MGRTRRWRSGLVGPTNHRRPRYLARAAMVSFRAGSVSDGLGHPSLRLLVRTRRSLDRGRPPPAPVAAGQADRPDAQHDQAGGLGDALQLVLGAEKKFGGRRTAVAEIRRPLIEG